MENNIFKNLYKKIINLEFKTRNFLSRHKVLYALLAGAGVVFYWRGVWHLSDYLESDTNNNILRVIFSPLGSLFLGVILLFAIGLLVQEFIGTDVIISDLKKEKRDIDKTEEELLKEEMEEKRNEKLIKEIDDHLHDIEKKLHENDKQK